MKLTEIKIQITRRIGNYESATIGGTWAVSDDEDRQEQELFAICNDNILQVFAKNYALPLPQQPQQPQQPQPQQQQQKIQKKKLTIDSPELSAVTKRISEGVSVDEVLKYYDVDDKMLAILHLAEGK